MKEILQLNNIDCSIDKMTRFLCLMFIQKKIIFINPEDIYHAIIYDNCRFPNETVCDMKIFQNYDMKRIKATYIKYLIFYSNLSEDSFACLRPSFIPFKSMKPFYGLDEMICAAINLGIINESFYEALKILLKDNDLLLKICKSIQKIDTSSSNLIKHQNHVIESGNSNLIHYYTTHGSADLNLAFIYLNAPMIYMHRIKLIRDCILSTPLTNKDFTFNRFFRGEKINNKYINNIEIGEIIVFNQFLSCTREITTNSDKFGNTLFKIVCNPKNISYYLFIEMFSDCPEEKEVILAPRSKFKVLSIDDFYYATKSHNRLCRKLHIEYIETDIFKIDLKPMPFYHMLVSEDELDEFRETGLLSWIFCRI